MDQPPACLVAVYEDAGISGAKGRDKRPGLDDAMMKAVNAKEFDMVASWSVDRLGRSLTDLLGILQNLHEKGVGLLPSGSTPEKPEGDNYSEVPPEEQSGSTRRW